MADRVNDAEMVASCGLFCGACKAYLKNKCPGCRENERAAWCKVRSCCRENRWHTCADCRLYSKTRDCKKYHNIIARIFGYVFNSDRSACIRLIREHGREKFARVMAERRARTIRLRPPRRED